MIAIIKSDFNKEIVDGLLEGCKRALISEKIKIISVPGAFELPRVAKKYSEMKKIGTKYNKYKAVITLGCVIKGDTDHYDYICQAVSKGIMDISINSDIPILFGILTCQNAELAFERSRNNESNKGYEVGLAALDLLK